MQQYKASHKEAPVSIFYSYAHEDKTLRDELEKHLSLLQRQGIVSQWHDRQILAGTDWTQAIDIHVKNASIFLLLISPDFLASDYCYGIEMQLALDRHRTGGAYVIPVILRPVDWQGAPFAHLRCLPHNGEPITLWGNQDAAFLDVVRGIREIITNDIDISTAIIPTQKHVTLHRDPLTNHQPVNSQRDSRHAHNEPKNYIPFARNLLFQARPGEFELLEHLLLKSKQIEELGHVEPVGIIGMGGVGKTQLAVEFAYRYQNFFPGGIFWMPATGHSHFEWQYQLANLAFNAEYLPYEDDVSHPENEPRRARHFCRYLAHHPDALIILDNVESPSLVTSVLPALAGGEAFCTILYTSRVQFKLPGVTTYPVAQLPEEESLHLLLETTNPALLSKLQSGEQSSEIDTARLICKEVGYLPLALVHLRGLLTRSPQLSLARLYQVLKQRGALRLTKLPFNDTFSLFTTFHLSWEKITEGKIQILFKLASFFPEAVPIPLWLLGIASDLGENGEIFEPLGEACLQLQEISLLEILAGNQVRLHPLIREFGRILVEEDNARESWLEEAGDRLIKEFANLNKLEKRAKREGYWKCLGQVQEALKFVKSIQSSKVEQLVWIERSLDRESYLLGDKKWWPDQMPGLFYQQIFNRSIQEKHMLQVEEAPSCWLRQENHVETHDKSLRIFAGHADIVNSVAFSPNGSQVLTGSEDRTARLWEAATGKTLAILAGHTKAVTSVAFSPNGSQVLTGSEDRTARLWEATTGKTLVILAGHTKAVTSVAFSPNGSQVLTGSEDRTARLWEAATGKQLIALEGHTKTVTSVAFSPNGSQILTGSEDRTARLWENISGKLITIFDAYTKIKSKMEDVVDVAFILNGQQILTGSLGGRVRIWERASGKLLDVWESHKLGVLTSMMCSNSGQQILTGSGDRTARLIETSSGKLISLFEGHGGRVTSVSFSPDGQHILTGSFDQTARLWEIPYNHTLVRQQKTENLVASVAFFPNGQRVVNGSYYREAPGFWKAHIWEIANDNSLLMLDGHENTIRSIAVSPDEKQILTGSDDGKIRLWEAATGKLLTILEGHKDIVWSLTFSQDGKYVLSGSEDKTAQLWEASSGMSLTTLMNHKAGVMSVAISSDGQRLLTGSEDGTARLWETTTGKELLILRDPSMIWSVAISSDGQRLLTGSVNRTARLWETNTGKELTVLKEHNAEVNYVAISPNGSLLITCDNSSYVYIWRTSGEKQGELLGLYRAIHGIRAVNWQTPTDCLLADTWGNGHRSHIYHLRLVGM